MRLSVPLSFPVILTLFLDLGVSSGVIANYYAWRKIWLEVSTSYLPPLPPQTVFTPKYKLPVLKDYQKNAPESFWTVFPKNLTGQGQSLVRSEKLQALANQVPSIDKTTLGLVLNDLRHGAKIGCSGAFRDPSRASNAPSAYEDGHKVTDAICDWVNKKFAYGPVRLDEVPKNAKFSGIMTRAKPNGSVRIILNLSSPAGRAVNEGIDPLDFPATMSSTNKWLLALNKAGHNCLICKCDWSDAYKHLAVHPDDLPLQWFTWLGRAFCELCLVFGGVSSAGLYDRLAKIVLAIVIDRSGFDPALVIQHLDDVCAAGPAASDMLFKFDAEFQNTAKYLGIKLAPRDDPTKSFGPSTSGVVLGVVYDTVAWTWAIPEEKFIRLLHDLRALVDAKDFAQDRMWSVVGKLIHVKPLVPAGNFNIYHLIKANSFSTDPKAMVPVDADLRRQAWFWFSALQVCSGRSRIPDPGRGLPAWTLDIYTDAAGGSWRTLGQGVGAVGPGFWAVLPWGRAINAGRPTGDGRRLDRIMSALELMGPLLALCSAAPLLKGRPLRFHVDNAGSVYIYKKGYSSSCRYSSAIASAIASVAAGLGCEVELVKITRCSTVGAELADDLSKGALGKFWDLARSTEEFSLPLEPSVVPGTLVRWASDPKPDFNLGHDILQELSKAHGILGYSL